MRILFVCHRFPFPPARGGKIRPFNIIRHLSQNHRVTVASLARSPEEAAQGEGIAPHCERFLMETIPPASAWLRMWANLPSPRPSSMGYFHSPRLARRIEAELAREPVDLIFVHCSSVAPYVEAVRGVPKVMDFGDMDSQKWLTYAEVRGFPLSLGYRIEGRKLERAEARIARNFDLCTCTTRAELESLQALDQPTPSDWFPNGVDLEKFRPAAEPYDRDSICFIGRMDYYPNQEGVLRFCREILPRLKAARPALKLQVVGAEPSREIQRLGEIEGVTVTGTVPDVQPYVQRSCLTVAPLSIARGTQNKILESLAMGVPVVTSELAAKGVDVVPGEHLLAAGDAEAFAAAVLRLLDSEEERRRFAEAGRRRVETHHAWPASMRKLDGILESFLQAKASRDGGSPGTATVQGMLS